VTLAATVPYCVGLVAMLLIGWSSDRSGERRWHTALSMATAGVGLLREHSGTGEHSGDHTALLSGGRRDPRFMPGFWALPTAFSRYGSRGFHRLINSVGNWEALWAPTSWDI